MQADHSTGSIGGQSYSQVAVHFHPDYYGIWSKTAEIDDSMLIDRPETGAFMQNWCSRLGPG